MNIECCLIACKIICTDSNAFNAIKMLPNTLYLAYQFSLAYSTVIFECYLIACEIICTRYLVQSDHSGIL